MMSDKEAYKILAKHVFVAFRKRVENPRKVVVMANDSEHALVIANRYFGFGDNAGKTFVTIQSLNSTDNINVFEIE